MILIHNIYTGNSTHFQVGGDNSKVEWGPAKPVYKTKPYFTFTFENKVAGIKIQLDRQFARCLAAMECPVYRYIYIVCGLICTLYVG